MTYPIESLTVTLDGHDIALRRCGHGPLVLCLHGFPDAASTWDDLLPVLAAAGYCAVAPFMRGYAPSTLPTDDRFDATALAGDVLALADRLAPEAPFRLVGHDWGAIAGYAAAGVAGKRLAAMVTAAVPPTARFLANMHGAQLRRSWYMGLLQVPGLAERVLAHDDMALIDRLWRAWSPGWAFTAADTAPVKKALATPAHRRAACRYYRALRPLLLDSQRRRAVMRWQTDVPTRLIFGETDGCIGPEMFAGSRDCFTGAVDCQGLAAGHFMHREQPAQFAERVLDWFSDYA